MDIVIVKFKHIHNDAVWNKIQTLLESKTLKNMKRKDYYSPQVNFEQFVAF